MNVGRPPRIILPPPKRYAWKVSSSFLTINRDNMQRSNIPDLITRILNVVTDPNFDGKIIISREVKGDC
jgi:hypothetical protein